MREMLVLDTDHLVELDRGAATGAALEQFRGWLAQMHRQHDPHEQIVAYHRLQRRIDFFAAGHMCSTRVWG